MALTHHLLLTVLLTAVLAQHDIQYLGAIAHQDTQQAQIKNAQIINAALLKANASEERTVLIPSKTYYSMPISLNNLVNVTLEIRGKLIACNRIKHYPKTSKTAYQDFVQIYGSKGITITGGGKIDGRGYIWWLNTWLVTKKYMPAHTSRPHLVDIANVRDLNIHDITVKNSPQFHFRMKQTVGVKMYNIDIKVNTTAQIDILKRNWLTGIIPLFPLNTDGIDPSGKDMHIYNITCQNYDDVVVPKPAHTEAGQSVNCTQNILAENLTVRLGVGVTIGSVPPNKGTNCVRNITFRNVHMQRPLKGIYVKTNPGQQGDGIIADIVYENITMVKPVWWAVYLGPQQQKQPDGGGPGCMLYPFDPKGTCATQPRINITNVVLRNVNIQKSLLFPFIFRCNKTNPCKDIILDNVHAHKWRIGKKDKGYVCENVEMVQKNTYPKVECTVADEQPKPRLTVNQEQEEHMIMPDILREMEQANREMPYHDDDDDGMATAHQWLKEDHQFFDTMEVLVQ